MALIRACCDDCGDVELRSRDLKVRQNLDTLKCAYRFRCPVCMFTQVRDAEDRIVDILTAAGVELETWEFTREVIPATLPPITVNDVIDMHTILEDETNIERWLNA